MNQPFFKYLLANIFIISEIESSADQLVVICDKAMTNIVDSSF